MEGGESQDGTEPQAAITGLLKQEIRVVNEKENLNSTTHGQKMAEVGLMHLTYIADGPEKMGDETEFETGHLLMQVIVL